MDDKKQEIAFKIFATFVIIFWVAFMLILTIKEWWVWLGTLCVVLFVFAGVFGVYAVWRLMKW